MPDTFSGGKNLGSQVADTPATPPTDTPDYATIAQSEEVARELALKPFKQIFGEISEHDQHKLDFVIKAIKGDNTKMDTEEVLSRIRSIEKKLGLSWHEPILERVYRHVKLVKAVSDSLVGGL